MAGGILSLTVDVLYVDLFMVGPSHILTIFKCKLGTFFHKVQQFTKVKKMKDGINNAFFCKVSIS